MAHRSQSTQGLVIKRVSTGEADRIITLLTPDEGKIVCIAKGVRKISSTQRAYLEPGNYVSVLLVQTKSMPILTQTRLINDFSELKKSLGKMKKMVEILEIIDVLFVEGVEEQQLFEKIISILEQLAAAKTSFSKIQQELIEILILLGYQDLRDTSYTSVLEYVSNVAEKPLKSYDYMTIK